MSKSLITWAFGRSNNMLSSGTEGNAVPLREWRVLLGRVLVWAADESSRAVEGVSILWQIAILRNVLARRLFQPQFILIDMERRPAGPFPRPLGRKRDHLLHQP